VTEPTGAHEQPHKQRKHSPRPWWRDPRSWPLSCWGFGLIISGLVHLMIWGITGGPWEGPVTWRKPILFGISGGLTSLSMGWVWGQLPAWRHDRRLAWATAIALVIEVGLIDLQCWRGVPSHFNRSTSLDSFLYDTMGLLILWVTGVIIYVTVRFFLQPTTCSPDMRLAVQAGLIYLVISCLLGIWVGLNGDLRMQAGLEPEQFGEAGVPKFPHGVVIHALQWLPMLAWGASRAGFRPKTRLRLVSVAGRASGLLLIYALGETLLGRARFDPPAGLATLLVVAVAGLVLPAAIVAFGLIRQLFSGWSTPPAPS
jgi:hypothetical protein